jgi:hypothetical protein
MAVISNQFTASVKLSRFWARSLPGLFRTADAQFAIRGVVDSLDQYYLVLGALSEANIDMVREIVEEVPDDTSFRRLRKALVKTHVLWDYQRIDRLSAMEPLNSRKPSESLVAMSKLQLADHWQYFAYFFLQWLPREVRILLSQEPVVDMIALAGKADALMALHKLQQHNMAAVTPPDLEDATVTGAAKSSGLKKAGHFKKKKPHCRQRSLSPVK